MPAKIYNWKRFWCTRTGKLNLSDSGYLFDPQSEFGNIYNPDVFPFEKIATFHCLGLLGEPGIGKSTTMWNQKETINARVAEAGDTSQWVDLKAFQTDARLVKAIFEDPVFLNWKKGNHRLHLFLDSLDECLLRIDSVVALLLDELKRWPIERLSVRIACRTADWPLGLEKGLRELWGNDSTEVYELAPLRRRDVAEAATANGSDPDSFLAEVDRKEIVPLAIKPVTLEFLLNTFKRESQFPSAKKDLYFKGCRLLAEETSQSRQDARQIGRLTPDQRLAVASRVAALTVFTMRYAIWTSADRGDVPQEDITVSEMCGGKESYNEQEIEVSEAAIREVLDTGLFSSRGPGRIGWAHQTYAEYLAAYYLVRRGMAHPQILSLIVHPGDSKRKLVPQLHETAAWIAGMVPDVFRDIMDSDAEVLLKSDVATADVRDRQALVKTLLKLLEEEKVLYRDLGARGTYRKLSYPGLADHLKVYLTDRTKSLIVRREATDIAEACELVDVQDDLANIALDSTEPLALRTNAAYAIERIGADNTKKRFKKLLESPSAEDPDDELKGCALRVLWPTNITAEELFSILRPPKNDSFIGAYHLFLSYDLPKQIQKSHLTTALDWLESQPSRHEFAFAFRKLIDAIIDEAWDCIDEPDVLAKFASLATKKLRRLISDEKLEAFRDKINRDDEKRRCVLQKAVSIMSDIEKGSRALVYSRTPFALSRDVLWMLAYLRSVTTDREKQAWALLISFAFDPTETAQVDAVLTACDTEPALATVFEWLIRPVKLGSPEAKRMKENYLENQKWENRERRRPLLNPPPTERIAKLLDQCESGDYAVWWQLNMEMTLKPDSTHYGEELESDLTALPGWQSANDTTKRRIVEGAKKFLIEQDPETTKWLGTNHFFRPALAGYRAFRLLLSEAPDFIGQLDKSVWRKWAPIILAYPAPGDSERGTPHRELIKLAYERAPDEIIQTLLTLIDKDNADHGHIFILDKILDCWDIRISTALLEKVNDETLKPDSMEVFLRHLLEHRIPEAKLYAASLVRLPISAEGRAKAISAAKVLIIHADDGGWPTVWPAMQQDVDFGRQVALAVAHRADERRHPTISQRLSEDQLADLYIWLTRQFPYSQDPRKEGGRVSARESAAEWRDGILHNLKVRGTTRACDTIRRLIREFPELTWLKWQLLEAEDVTRRRTWNPIAPADILKIASDRDARLVQSGDGLLEAVIESLKRLETKLHGEIPAVQFLWDKSEKRTFSPKDEDALCNYIKLHLDQDLKEKGIICNREVQIHRRERTDIHVDAVVPGQKAGSYSTVTVIIEVKGCWNSELDRAMEEQLVGRYLKDNPCQHGLYLVGWFNCDLWDVDDYRKRNAPSISLDDARKKLAAQAEDLSKAGTKIQAFVMDAELR
jgi:predicted NACHT family NTPase